MVNKAKRNIEIKGNVSESIVGNNNVTINKNHKNKIWTIIVGVFTIIGVVSGIFFGVEQRQKNKEEIKENAIKTTTNVNNSGQQTNINNSGTIIINQATEQSTIEQKKEQEKEKQEQTTKPSKKTITVTETGTASNYSKEKAIELATDNAIDNLKRRRGLTDTEISSYELLEQKIDSLPNKISATVKVSVNVKER